SIYTVHLVLVFFASHLVFHLILLPDSPVIGKAAGLLFYFFCVLVVPPLRRSVPWLRLGKFNRRAIVFSLIVIAVAAAALMIWNRQTSPDPKMYASMIPTGIAAHWVLLYMASFAILNACIEEIIWRGVMLSALEYAFGPGLFAMMVQAFEFGFAHF